MTFTIPTEVYTAGQLRELDADAFEKARCKYEEIWGYSTVQNNIREILAGDIEFETSGAGSYWPKAVTVNAGSHSDFDIDYDLHYHSYLHLTAEIDLVKLNRQLKHSGLADLIRVLRRFLRKKGYEAKQVIVYWDGRSESYCTCEGDFGIRDGGFILAYMRELQTKLLRRLEQLDADAFSPESFIRDCANNQWVFNEDGDWQAWPKGTEKPAELVALFEKESD